MAAKKNIVSIAQDGDSLQVARMSSASNKLILRRLDRINLVTSLDKSLAKIEHHKDLFTDKKSKKEEKEVDDVIFGIEEALEAGEDINLDILNQDMEQDDLDLVDETEAPASNELLIYNLLSGINPKRIDVALNVQAGQTTYQLLKDSDFRNTKPKDLKVIIEDRLENVYGYVPAKDFTSFHITSGGSLLLGTIDTSPALLNMIDGARDLFGGKIFIDDVLPDETALLGLANANYSFGTEEVTAIVQFGETFCRIFFLKGNELFLMSPLIQEGLKGKKFLNTVFSKILFQLDTGEVPNLDRIIFANNVLGEQAISFFTQRFPDIKIENFQYDTNLIDVSLVDENVIARFTTSIAIAWASSGAQKAAFPRISMLPSEIRENQKIFKLQWHGILLLALIGIAPYFIFNSYKQNKSEIDRLKQESESLTTQINQLQPTVNSYNDINAQLSAIQSKLDLLNELNMGSLRWTKNLDLINKGFRDIGGIWLLSLSKAGNTKNYQIDGIALDRNQVPKVARLFHRATLLQVKSETLRDREVFRFTYLISAFYANEEAYNPSASTNPEIQEGF